MTLVGGGATLDRDVYPAGGISMDSEGMTNVTIASKKAFLNSAAH